MRRMAWGGIFLAALTTMGCGGGDDAPATSTTNTSNSKPAGGGPVVQPPGPGGGGPVAPPPAGGAPAAPPGAAGGGPPIGGGLPPPAGSSYGGGPGAPGFGAPPPGVGAPGGLTGPAPGGAPSAPVGGPTPNYAGMASAIGAAVTASPLSFYEKAMLCFQQGKDEEAFRYLYADAVTGSVKAKSLNMKWSAALKRPVIAIRFGVAVNYIKPEKYTGSPMAIGTKFNDQGQPQGVGGMGGPGAIAPPSPGGQAGGQPTDPAPTDPVANFEYYTGDYGKKLMVKLNEGIRAGEFGAFYQEAVNFTAPTQPQLNLTGLMGGPPANAPTAPGGGYGAPGSYGGPGGYAPGGVGAGSPNPSIPGGGLPPPAGAPPGSSSRPSTGDAGTGSYLPSIPRSSFGSGRHILAQQSGDGLSAGAPQLGTGAPGAAGPSLPGMGMGPGGMFGQQNNAPKPVGGVKYYGTGNQSDMVEKAKVDAVDVLIFFTVKVDGPNRRGLGADNTTTCRIINVHDGSPLYEGARGLKASDASKTPDRVDSAVSGVYSWLTDGATGSKGPIGKLAVVDELPTAVNAETVKGRVAKLSTAGGEGLEVMQRLAELRFYNARRILPLNDLKVAYEAILGPEKGAKLAMGSTNDKRLAIDNWNTHFEPALAPPPKTHNPVGTGAFGGPPGGAAPGYGGPSGGYGGPGSYGPGSNGPGTPTPPGSYAPGGSAPPSGSSPPPGGGFGAPPAGVGGPPGVGGSPNPSLPGSKGAGS